MDIVVVGAGASGLVAGIFAKNSTNRVTILERYDKSAKKILVTGNGRCNYWNEDFDNSHFNSSNDMFLEEVNTLENRNKVLAFFKSIGIIPTIKNGYYYPMSKEASSIRNALLSEAKKRKIDIYNNINVQDIRKDSNKFIVTFDNGSITCDKVIIATGSNSYYKEENLGYRLCEKLGHNIIEVLPSLVQLIGNGNYYKDWAGVRSNSKVDIYVNNELKKEEYGEIMLTDYGVSGICIFNLSGIANKALKNNNRVNIKINFLPEINNIEKFLEDRNKYLEDRCLNNFLEGLINSKLINLILKKVNLNNKYWKDLNKEEKNLLIDNLSNFNVEIIGSKSFQESQVCSGGVDTKEINPKTFESKKCPGLYIVGELLDVDGDCGGYNLGFAWISGMIAGESVNYD